MEKFGDPRKRVVFLGDDKESQEAKEFLDRLGVAYTIWPAGINTITPSVLIASNGNRFEGLREIKYYMWALQPFPEEIEKDPKGAKKVLENFEKIWKELKEKEFRQKAP
jgi:hypothetical protein